MPHQQALIRITANQGCEAIEELGQAQEVVREWAMEAAAMEAS